MKAIEEYTLNTEVLQPEVYDTTTGRVDSPRSAELSLIDPLYFTGWNDLVCSAPGYSFFHSANWSRVLVESYGYHPYYFITLDRSQLKVLLPLVEVNSWLTGRRAVSLPFSDYCEPIIDQKIDAGEMLAQVVMFGRRRSWKFIEMRGDGLAPAGIRPSSVFYRHTLSLEPRETTAWGRLRGNYRSKIQKAEKMGVRVDSHYSVEAMNEYHRLHCLSRKRRGLPPQPLRFFRKIYQHIISQNLGFIVLATHHGAAISGAVYVHFGRQILYKYGAMDSKYQHIPANYLVMWHAIRWACQNGFRQFCFGKSDAEQSGLIQYKDGWGAEKQELRYYRYHLNKDAFVQTERRSDGRGYFWFRAMPLPFLKKIGSLLYRHVG